LLIGDKVIGAYKRTAQTSFITTKGGLNERYDITAKEKKLAQMVAKVLQSDYIGLDIIYDRGKPVILEVNFDAGFKTFDQINGTDVAEEIIKQLLKK
jgi:glutathione synthase/RimK-type ligase-like ATP-grasp enzyme